MQDTLHFWRNFINDPRRVSAVAPSGSVLASMITREITSQHAPVIELGPGTGVFTKSLIDRGIPEDQLVLIEFGSAFAQKLAQRFPRAVVHKLDARTLNAIQLGVSEKAGAVVSGLPLRSMPRQDVFRIISSAFGHLRQDGVMYQFTYGVRSPVPSDMLERLNIRVERIGFVKANLPPASVFRISRLPK